MQAVAVDDYHLAGAYLPEVLSAQVVQSAGLGRDDPTAVQFAQTKGPDAQRVAGGNHGVFGLDHNGICAFQLAHALEDPFFPGGTDGVGQHLGDDFRVGGGGEGAVPFILELVFQLDGVDDVSVVGHGQLAVFAINQQGLGVTEFAAAAGGVSGVPDRHVSDQGVEVGFSEDLSD